MGRREWIAIITAGLIVVIVLALHSLPENVFFDFEPTQSPIIIFTVEPTLAPTIIPTLKPTPLKTLAPTPKKTPVVTVKPKPIATAKPVVKSKPEVIIITNDNYTKELLVEHSLETYYTNANSIFNSGRALDTINGYILKNNEEFSFNGIVGYAGYDQGYKKAPFSIGSGPGGGICSASTAIFQTARKAGLKITERYDHSEQGRYASLGNDAAIDWGKKNMRFLNNISNDLLIECNMSGTVIYVKIYKLIYN